MSNQRSEPGDSVTCRVHGEQLEDISKKLSGIIKTLYGNGGPGLLTRTAVMENKVETIIKNSTEIHNDVKTISRVLWGAVSVLSLLQGLVVYLITK